MQIKYLLLDFVFFQTSEVFAFIEVFISAGGSLTKGWLTIIKKQRIVLNKELYEMFFFICDYICLFCYNQIDRHQTSVSCFGMWMSESD